MGLYEVITELGTAVSPWPVHSAKILTLLGPAARPVVTLASACASELISRNPMGSHSLELSVNPSSELSDSEALRNAGVTTPCTRPATVDHLVNMCHREREPSPMARE